MNEKDKKMRNKIEVIAITFYTIGLVLSVVTHQLWFILITVLSVPFCFIKPVKKWLDKE